MDIISNPMIINYLKCLLKATTSLKSPLIQVCIAVVQMTSQSGN